MGVWSAYSNNNIGRIINLVNPMMTDDASSSGSATFYRKAYGKGTFTAVSRAAGRYQHSSANYTGLGAELSMSTMVIGVPLATSTGDAASGTLYAGGMNSGGGFFGGGFLQCGNGTSAVYRGLTTRGGAPNQFGFGGDFSVTVGEACVYIGIDVDGRQRMWVNGKKDTQEGTRAGAHGSRWFDHRVYSVNFAHAFSMLWTRELTDSEAEDLSENPWQIFMPQARRIWIMPAAAGGGGVVGTSPNRILLCGVGR